jgi:hypothetical protein
MLKPIAIFVFSILPTPVQAQAQCGNYNVVVDMLFDQYGESAMYAMHSGNGQVFLMFANMETGTWTRLILDNNMLCLDGHGGGFMIAPKGEPV